MANRIMNRVDWIVIIEKKDNSKLELTVAAESPRYILQYLTRNHAELINDSVSITWWQDMRSDGI